MTTLVVRDINGQRLFWKTNDIGEKEGIKANTVQFISFISFFKAVNFYITIDKFRVKIFCAF